MENISNTVKRKRGRPRLTPEQKLERQREKIKKQEEAKKRRLERQTQKKEATKPSPVKESTRFLLTPSGKCPVELHGFDEEAVSIWASHFKNTTSKGALHTRQSIEYWIRDFYSVHSEEHKEASSHLKYACLDLGIKDYEPHLKKIYSQIKEEIESKNSKNNS